LGKKRGGECAKKNTHAGMNKGRMKEKKKREEGTYKRKKGRPIDRSKEGRKEGKKEGSLAGPLTFKSAFTSLHLSRSPSGEMKAPPMTPIPPALDTAAASSGLLWIMKKKSVAKAGMQAGIEGRN
jgi:hypothetical protein